MTLLFTILCTLLLVQSVYSAPLVQYYCGFSGSFCGQSTQDDTNRNSSLIVLAFANIAVNGSIILDSNSFPCSLVASWQSQGKKVFLSIGGQGATWTQIFANQTSMNISIASIVNILSQTSLDGIDLDIQDYTAPPSAVSRFITLLKPQMRGKYLSVAPQCVGVYQGQAVPSAGGQYWNYWVPILRNTSSLIDLVMVQAYNNWYDGLQAGSLSYLQDIYLQWSNLPSSFCSGCSPIPNFTGVPSNKLVMGIPASPTAGTGSPLATTIDSFMNWQITNNYTIRGWMMWDSHWDSLNAFNLSNTIISGTSSADPLTPGTSNITQLCTS